jgi:Domain of unknown function (DUF6391)
MSLLDWPLIARTRRNHGLEHATVHILSTHHPGISVVGRSTPNCFYIYGDLIAEQIHSAANEALARLRAGESHLTIHPGCGTNLVVSGTLAGAAAFTAVNVGSRRKRWEMLPMAMLAATVALLLAQPLGPLLQERVTTSANMSTMEILGVWRANTAGVPVHRVDTRS